MKSGVISSFCINKQIEFPLRICDLTPNTHVAITIYDMYREQAKGPLASTVIDVFDSK
jgi:hypothetical protein